MKASPPTKESTEKRAIGAGRSGRVTKVAKAIADPPKQPMPPSPETGFKNLLLNGAPKIEDMMIPPREASPASTMGVEFDN